MHKQAEKIIKLFSNKKSSWEKTIAAFSKKRLAESLHLLTKQLIKKNKHIDKLNGKVAKLQEQIVELEVKVAKSKKNSSTSSKPPSSDIVKPTGNSSDNKGKRKKGGQKGHPKHERPLFPKEKVDNIIEHTLNACPDCGSSLLSAEEAPRVIQQVEIVEKPIRIDEHRGLASWCEHCQKVHYAPIPPEVEKAGLFGPRLSAQVAYQKGAGHASYSTIKNYLQDVLGISVSRGYLVKIVQKVSKSLAVPYDELLKQLPSEPFLNVDETGHKNNGDRFWTWCFRAETYVLFKIAGSRGSQILLDVLGEEFAGILGCDYFSAYRKYMKDCDVYVQFCLAHLIRDLKYLTTLSDKATVAYGESLLQRVRDMFAVIHQRHLLSPEVFEHMLLVSRQMILDKGTSKVPETREAQNIAKRFKLHGDSFFRFITTPGVQPTNNLAEQAIRFVVIDRLITQGTRSIQGQEWCQRIWTVLASCANQSRSAFDFLYHALKAYFNNQQAPSFFATPP